MCPGRRSCPRCPRPQPTDDDIDCANASDLAYQAVFGSHPGVSCDDLWSEVTVGAVGCFAETLIHGCDKLNLGVRSLVGLEGQGFRDDNLFCAAGRVEAVGAGVAIGGAAGGAGLSDDDAARYADDLGLGPVIDLGLGPVIGHGVGGLRSGGRGFERCDT